MGLPPYSGAFKVGVLDLEIPVRKPRSFCNNVVNPKVLNKPAAKARRWAKKQNKEAKESRKEKQQGGSASNEGCSYNDEEEGADDSPWSPWSTGSKTCTLHLETVLFTIYYPALPMPEDDFERYPRAAWLGRPVHAGAHALLHYVGQYGVFALPASPAVLALINAHLPARVGPPLADPEELRKRAHPDRTGSDRPAAGNFGNQPPQFPVVVFSHGLAGNRLSYSQYCGELASKGMIVAAIEHRDGSGVSSIVRGEEAPDKADRAGFHIPHIGRRSSGRMKASVPYFTFEKIGLQSFATDPSEEEVNLRRDQIEMRQAEIEETVYVLEQINAGKGDEIVQRSTRNLGTKLAGHAAAASRLPGGSLIGSSSPLQDWKGLLDMDYPTLCGHSFGGATVIEMMRKPNPFPMAMVLDPWVEPVRDPTKEEDQVEGRLDKPIYILNSESFTVWEEHFEKLKRICLDARKTSGRGWLLTLTGSKHTDFSDYPFLLPRIFRSTVGPRHTMEVYCKATYMQVGLSRQRIRERQNERGYKVDRQGSLADGDARQQSAKLPPRATTMEGLEQVTSPMKTDERTQEDSDGLEERGKALLAETIVKSPECEVKHADQAWDTAVDANANARQGSATPANVAPHSTQSSRCQDLREESKQDQAAVGQEARDMVGARQQQQQQQASFHADSATNRVHEKGFITDLRYLKMIDADQDVQQVHAELEEVAERLKNKSKSVCLCCIDASLCRLPLCVQAAISETSLWR